MKERLEEDTYKTKILNIAAYLYAAGLPLVDTDRINGEVFFFFSSRDEAEILVEKYYSGSALVNPRDLFARLNDLRDLIFSGGRNG